MVDKGVRSLLPDYSTSPGAAFLSSHVWESSGPGFMVETPLIVW